LAPDVQKWHYVLFAFEDTLVNDFWKCDVSDIVLCSFKIKILYLHWLTVVFEICTSIVSISRRRSEGEIRPYSKSSLTLNEWRFKLGRGRFQKCPFKSALPIGLRQVKNSKCSSGCISFLS
jgi:hypothetical protein